MWLWPSLWDITADFNSFALQVDTWAYKVATENNWFEKFSAAVFT